MDFFNNPVKGGVGGGAFTLSGGFFNSPVCQTYMSDLRNLHDAPPLARLPSALEGVAQGNPYAVAGEARARLSDEDREVAVRAQDADVPLVGLHVARILIAPGDVEGETLGERGDGALVPGARHRCRVSGRPGAKRPTRYRDRPSRFPRIWRCSFAVRPIRP